MSGIVRDVLRINIVNGRDGRKAKCGRNAGEMRAKCGRNAGEMRAMAVDQLSVKVRKKASALCSAVALAI